MWVLFWLLALQVENALPHGTQQGLVKFGGLPLPGASVKLTQGGQAHWAITDSAGVYRIAGLADGSATVEISMQLFQPARREVRVGGLVEQWEMVLLGGEELARIATTDAAQRVAVNALKPAAETKRPAAVDPSVANELAQRAADGLLINGSVNNGAASTFAQLPAFGNNRRGQRSLYNGNLGVILNNGLFDARAYSLTGQSTPKPAYSRVQALVTFGGPLKIPGWIDRNGPIVSVNYQWTRNSNASTQTGLMPTEAARGGDFSGLQPPVVDPLSGAPFNGNRIPASRVSPQAQALLGLYPLPNFVGSSRYNYQAALVNGQHQDDLQTRINKQVRKNFFSGNFAWQSTRTDSPDLFGFLDTGSVRGINAGTAYRRTFSARAFLNVGYQLSRLTTRVQPYFAGLRNVSGEAGIMGNNQEAMNWGPPALQFASGITGLGLPQASLVRNQTGSVTVDGFLSRGSHNLFLGGAHRRQQFNVNAQQDARGTFAFTGAAVGSDFAGFLLGVPDTSSIAFGNADKYLRAVVHEAFLNDDWRVNPGLTINAGVRYEYWSPVTEKYGRLVNLAVGPGYSTATPVVARQAEGGAFPRPDRNNFAPRVAFSWRPMAASSLVIRGGYGVYFDTSVYQALALRMAQQAPLSVSLRVANSRENPLTLANGFVRPESALDATTFGVDPGFRVGYSQNWQFSLQRDLPAGFQLTATYQGSKGTRGQQQFLPNTFPLGTVGPAGYTYLTSNGNANRQAAQVQLRRRLRSGLTASWNYTYSKAIDNSALGGRNPNLAWMAQNWLDLAAERARSNFDQRHQMTGMVSYTTGMGLKGGALANGWKAALWKEWTLSSMVNATSGLPLTPVYLSAVRGTGVTGTLRPDFTGASLYDAPAGLHLNPAAVTAPGAGRWGNAGRNSIDGPSQLVVNASLGRTFRGTERVSMDLRIDAANVLNQVTYPGWNTVLGNAQFGLPMTVNPMRTIQAALRMRF